MVSTIVNCQSISCLELFLTDHTMMCNVHVNFSVPHRLGLAVEGLSTSIAHVRPRLQPPNHRLQDGIQLCKFELVWLELVELGSNMEREH